MASKKSSKKIAPKKITKKLPAKKAPVKKAPVKKAPVKKAPVKKAPVKKAPVKKAPAKKAAAKKAPIKKVPVKKVVPATKIAVAKKTEKAAPVIAPKAPPKPATPKAPSRKSSLMSTPPPIAPIKPRFVPPKVDTIPKSQNTDTGTHSASFIKKQGQRLLDLHDSLVDSMSGMTRDTIRNAPEGSEASGSGQHQGDAGSDAYDRDFALSVLAKEQDALYEVKQALYRIKTGTYGNCEISNHKIPIARLEAVPFARLTVECQADWEKEYGTRKFRPSDEVGFSGGIQQEDEDSVTVSLDGDDD